MLKRLTLSISTALLAATSFTQNAPPRLSDPLTGSGLQIKYTYRYDFRDRSDRSYFGVFLKDKSLFERGTALSPTEIPIEDDLIGFGDAPLTLKYGDGLTETGGTLLSGLGLKPLSFLGGPKNLRLLVGWDGQLQKREQSTVSAGVEWLPFGALQLNPETKVGNFTTETFLGLSARYQHRDPVTDDVEENGSVDARARFGIGLNLKVSKQRALSNRKAIQNLRFASDEQFGPSVARLISQRGISVAEALRSFSVGAVDENQPLELNNLDLQRSGVRLMRNTVAGRSQLRTFLDNFRSAAPSSRSANTLSKVLLDEESQTDSIDRRQAQADAFKTLIVPSEDDRTEIAGTSVRKLQGFRVMREGLVMVLEEYAKGDDEEEKFSPNLPALAFFTELDGTYAYVGDAFGGRRARGVLSLNAKYLFDSKDENSPYLWIRYEVGRTRAEPDQSINGFLFMAGWRF